MIPLISPLTRREQVGMLVVMLSRAFDDSSKSKWRVKRAQFSVVMLSRAFDDSSQSHGGPQSASQVDGRNALTSVR